MKPVDRRLCTAEAAAYLTEAYFPTAARSMARLEIPYVVVHKRRLYKLADLISYAETALSSAMRRTGR